MDIFHPWRRLRNNHPQVDVCYNADLPPHVMGHTDGQRIWLREGLTQAERRTTLTHEMIHIERGHMSHSSHVLQAREESTVERITAERLIPLPALLKALQWTRNRDELAGELWCDRQAVVKRLKTLSPAERAWLEERLND